MAAILFVLASYFGCGDGGEAMPCRGFRAVPVMQLGHDFLSESGTKAVQNEKTTDNNKTVA